MECSLAHAYAGKCAGVRGTSTHWGVISPSLGVVAAGPSRAHCDVVGMKWKTLIGLGEWNRAGISGVGPVFVASAIRNCRPSSAPRPAPPVLRPGRQGQKRTLAKPRIVFALLCNPNLSGDPVRTARRAAWPRWRSPKATPPVTPVTGPGRPGEEAVRTLPRCRASCSSATGGCSPMPASARKCGLRGWSGSPRCGLRRQSSCWGAATCSSRSSTNTA